MDKKAYFAIALTALLLLGFLATSLVSYFVAERSFAKRIAGEALPLTSDNIYSETERDLLRSVLISSLMAHDTFVLDWAAGGELEPEKMIRYLREIQEKYDTTTTFFVSEKTRRYYHPTGILKTVDDQDPSDAWYLRVRGMAAPYEINIDPDTADRSRLSIFINYRVTDADGSYLGATGIGLSVNTVAKLIDTYQRRYGRQIYFIDREGDVTVRGAGYQGPDRIQDRPGLGTYATLILTSPSASITYKRPDGETVYVNSRLMPELNWYLLVEQSNSEAETRVLDTLLLNGLVALAITALVLVIGYYSLRGYQSRLEEMATTDKLTGAANRHVLDLIFRHVVTSSWRRREPVSLVIIDLDQFKQINDAYGHQTGDAVLRRVADLARASIRESDTLCRWGGDEFFILIGNCDLECAYQIGEKIRKATEQPVRIAGQEITIRLSMGVVQYAEGEDLSTLARRADAALYSAKRQGRNRVVQA